MTPEEIALTSRIGKRLRAARTAQKLSLSQLSTKTGGILTKSRISNYEQGLRRMGLKQAQMLSDAPGTVSAAFLPLPKRRGLPERAGA
jgi:transcriptional regulator with XRE-family HTH domain